MNLKHIVTANDFDKNFISNIFSLADKIRSNPGKLDILGGKVMATLFYEPSTRTRLSFESAMVKLGGSTISTENAAEFSSAAKGESLEDTIRVVNSFTDVIVLRHFTEGASKIAAKYSNVPIINAGDGKGEHPTQALLDLYTIFSKYSDKGSQDLPKLTIAMIGDLKNGRTIHSLAQLLSLYSNFNIIFVSPKALMAPDYVTANLKKRKVNFTETENLTHAIAESDVIYQTRIQKERFVSKDTGENEYLKYFGKYQIDKKALKLIKNNAIIMHPLPRVNEISPEVDSDARAIYFEQVQNGLYIRMALLLYLFDKDI